MKLIVDPSLFASYVSKAHAFTDRSSSAKKTLTCVLIEADQEKGTVRFTAESPASAIQFSVSEGIEIVESGRILINSSWILTALNVVTPNGIPAEDAEDAGPKKKKGKAAPRVNIDAETDSSIHVYSGKAETRLATIPLKNTDLHIPGIGDIDKEEGLEFEPQDFADTFWLGSSSYDSVTTSVGREICVQYLPELGGVRFASTDKTSLSYAVSQKASPTGADQDSFNILLDPISLGTAFNYFAEGDKVTLYKDDDNETISHFLVTSKEGAVQYHVQINNLSFTFENYPINQLMERMAKGIVKDINGVLRVDKFQLLDLFRRAEQMGTLNPSDNGGQGKTVHVKLDKTSLNASIPGDASFTDDINVRSWTGSPLALDFKWGLYGSMLSRFPSDDAINIAFIERTSKPKSEGEAPRKRVVAMALFTDEQADEVEDGNLPNNYLCVIPVQGEYTK